jgi:predicted ABC-type transport system involved in lysophospholipase L1 biosynthesis ATPase subunit
VTALLEFERVSRRRGRDGQELALRDVSLAIDAGELVTVWGQRRSGRSTLMRVAAGLQAPDEGVVRFRGRDLSKHDTGGFGEGIRFCRKTFRPAHGRDVLEQLVTAQLHGVGPRLARVRALDALERTGALACATCAPGALSSAELARVALARALSHRPRMLVIDEPTLGVDLRERDQILSLLLSIDRGELRGRLAPAELAPVIPLRDRPAAVA